MIILAKFSGTTGAPRGRDYTYGCNELVAVGGEVYTEAGEKLIVTSWLAEEEASAAVERFGDRLKYVTKVKLGVAAEIVDASVPINLETALLVPLVTIPELSVDIESVIIVQQLPMITEKLKELSTQIDLRITAVTSLACTAETKTEIKTQRAALNALFNDLEARRIAVKRQILAPYDAFEAVYRELVTDKFKAALATLDERTGAIDGEIKAESLQDVQAYFAEYALAKGIDWLTFEMAGIKVGLSDNKKALRQSATDFINQKVQDIELIDTQTEAAEIHVEYRKTLNAALAIKTVKDRHAAVEQEKKRQDDLRLQRAAEEERLKAMAATAPQVAAPVIPEIKPPMPMPESPVETTEPLFTMAFRVTGTREELITIKRILKDNGYTYQQILMKNIKEDDPNGN